MFTLAYILLILFMAPTVGLYLFVTHASNSQNKNNMKSSSTTPAIPPTPVSENEILQSKTQGLYNILTAEFKNMVKWEFREDSAFSADQEGEETLNINVFLKDEKYMYYWVSVINKWDRLKSNYRINSKSTVKLTDISTYHDEIEKSISLLSDISSSIRAYPEATILQLTNDEAYEMYTNLCYLEDGDAVGFDEFYLDGYSEDDLKDLALRIVCFAGNLRRAFLAHEFSIENIKGISSLLYDVSSLIYGDINRIRDIYKNYYSIIKGVGGERKVSEYLENIMLDGYRYIDNAVLPVVSKNTDRNRFECDGILITEKHIYVLEIKNYSSGSLYVSNDGRVEHYDSRGNILEEDRSVIEQCETNVIFLSQLLGERFGSEISKSVSGIIVIANDSVEIENNSKYPIVRLSLLRTEIFSNENNIHSVVSSSEVSEYILEKKMPEYKYEYIKPEILIGAKDYEELIDEIDKANWAFAHRKYYFTKDPESTQDDDYNYTMKTKGRYKDESGYYSSGNVMDSWQYHLQRYLYDLVPEEDKAQYAKKLIEEFRKNPPSKSSEDEILGLSDDAILDMYLFSWND